MQRIAPLFLSHSDSSWALCKLLTAYSSFLYNQSWMSALLWIYFIKVIAVLIFLFDDWKHPSWYNGQGSFDINYASTSSNNNNDSSQHHVHLESIFIGDLFINCMGFFLADIQTRIIHGGSFYGFTSDSLCFMSPNAWYQYFTTSCPHREGSIIEEPWYKKYGIWPLKYIFPLHLWYNGPSRMMMMMVTRGEAKSTNEEIKWLHRCSFWIYTIQMLLLEWRPALPPVLSPWSQHIRGDIILEFVIHLILLICCFAFNSYIHGRDKKLFSSSTYNNNNNNNDNNNDNNKNDRPTTIWSHFHAQYLCWFLTYFYFSVPLFYKKTLVSPSSPHGGSYTDSIFMRLLLLWLMALGLWSIVYISSLVTPIVHKLFCKATGTKKQRHE